MIKEPIVFYLPWPPTVNSYYSCTKYGIHIGKKGTEYKIKVEESIFEQNGKLRINEKIRVDIILHPPDKRERDLDNYNKGLLDALTNAELWESDKLIDQLFIYRGQIVKKGKVVLIIKEPMPLIPDGYENLILI